MVNLFYKKRYLSFCLVLMIFALNACQSNQQLKQERFVQPNSIDSCFKATGYGETERSARKDALNELTKSIIVVVKNQYSEKSTYMNNKFDQTVINELSQESNMLLKGVKYSKPIRKDTTYHCIAYLPHKALLSTIKYLDSEISKKLNALSIKDLKKIIKNAHYLLAILITPSDCHIPDEKVLISRTQSILNQVNQHIHFGIVTFKVTPKDAVIYIDNEKYKPYDPIWLKADHYLFKVIKNGYVTASGRFSLKKRQKLSPVIKLVPEMNKELSVFVNFKADDISEQACHSIISSMGIKSSSSKAGNAINLVFKKQTSEVDNISKHKVTLYVEAYKGKEKLKTISVSESFYSKSNNNSRKIKEKKIKLAHKGIRKLFQRIQHSNFRSNEIVNYAVFFNKHPDTPHEDDMKRIAEKIKMNTIKLSTKSDEMEAHNNKQFGFGFIIGKKSNYLYAATAKHVIEFKEYEDEPAITASSIKACFFNPPDHFDVTKNIRVIARDAHLDLAILKIPRPEFFKFTRNYYASEIEEEDKAKFIGKENDWYIPSTEGGVNLSKENIKVEIFSILPGTSGAPLITSKGLVGMIIKDSIGSAKATYIKDIKQFANQHNIPWNE